MQSFAVRTAGTSRRGRTHAVILRVVAGSTYPLSSGMLLSITIRAGAWARAISTPRRPFDAVSRCTLGSVTGTC